MKVWLKYLKQRSGREKKKTTPTHKKTAICFYKQSFIGTQPYLFIYILSIAAFTEHNEN